MNTEMQRRLITPLVRGLIVCLFGASGFASAATISEAESNDSLSSAQAVSVPAEGLTISGAIGNSAGDATTDADFYSFDATEGDTPLIQIVGALKADGTGTCAGFPSLIALFDSLGNVRAMGDAECATGMEPRIFNSTLPATGKYYVVVSGYPHWADQGGVLQNMEFATPGGTYQLVIGGVRDPNPAPPPAQPPVVTPPPVDTPPAQSPPPVQPPPSSAKHVPIEVMRWHQEERDLDKRGGLDPITVVILSMDGFDATTADANSLTFGKTGFEKSLYRCRKNAKDINRDGRMDMVCYFKGDVANFQTGDLNGVLKGKTKSGQQIEGSAALKIFTIPTEKRGFKRHGRNDSDQDDRKNGKDKRRN
ncbi:MAG: hypothetical protein ABI648_10290 [Betaproteobacteria bacterium]